MGGHHSGSLTVNVRPKRELLEQVLEAVPGIDWGSACAILAELSPDQSAFASPRHVAAQACVAPRNNQVADKRRVGRVRPGRLDPEGDAGRACAPGGANREHPVPELP